ncbi:outer membrane beta-barrel protein [Polaribacter sargassicola]|uniref:outer membrane beta-barrel protein n=1 Tax=Polaribacter sargassicola TaxID=2836891 RepID=UPI001F164BB2|nr:outer membrane beta-barrel protein [Polaribacter sp. DS7-9]MCG1036905.1 outer membrane beta-barrel protein [Polaribacter sp. DS7-9]
MKKIILTICLVLGLSQISNAQINFGLKGGVNYNNSGDATFSSTGNDVLEGAESKSGYHAGIWFRGNLPIVGLYLRPEIVYTQVKSEYIYNNSSTDYNFKKIDVPVLIGKKFFGFANAFIGPSFQYILDDEFNFSNLTTDEFEKFSIGAQMGFGIEIGNLGVDVRWERGLSENEAKFTNITIDNRTDQIIFGLSFKL